MQMLGLCNTTVVTEAFAMDIQTTMKRRTGTLPLRSAVSMSLDGVRGLQALHEASIVHYDVKPAQMLVAEDELEGGGGGGELRVKLNDFNVVFFMSSRPDGTPCPFTVDGALQLGPWRTPEYLAQKVRHDKEDLPSSTCKAGRLSFRTRRSVVAEVAKKMPQIRLIVCTSMKLAKDICRWWQRRSARRRG